MCIPQVAEDLGPGHTIVTCLCDSGQVSCAPPLLIRENISMFVLLVVRSATLPDYLIKNGCSLKVYNYVF